MSQPDHRRSMDDGDQDQRRQAYSHAMQRQLSAQGGAGGAAAATTPSQADSTVVTPSAQEPPSHNSLSPDGSLLTPRAPTEYEDAQSRAEAQSGSGPPLDYFSVAGSTQQSSNGATSYTPAGEPPAAHKYGPTSGIVPAGDVVGALPHVPHPGFGHQHSKLWRRTTPKRSMTDLPNFPRTDAAMHHPAPILTAVERAAMQTDPSNGEYHSYSAGPIHDGPATIKEKIVERAVERATRTEDNTPANTPGLFSPRSLRKAFTTSEESSPYPSPYLHPVQPQVPPKETHIANREIDFHSGRKLVNQYEIINELGRGVHGKVKLGRNIETGAVVAIKIVQRFSKKRRLGKLYQNQEETVKREIAILKKIHHPHVVRMIEVIDDPEQTKIYMVLEFCELREINWRTRGSDEILIIENRRLDREAKGINDLNSRTHSEKQGERLMRAAAKRREQAQKRRPLGPRRADSEFWSLEFAADNTDEEDENVNTSTSAPLSRPTSRVSSLAPEDSQSVAGNIEVEEEVDPVDLQLQPRESSVPASQSRPQPTSEPHIGAQAIDFQPIAPTPQKQHSLQQEGEDQLGDLSTSLWNRLSESLPSMSDAHESSRGRQSSIADSTVSHMSAIVEREFPEDLRFVPTMTIPECRQAFRDAVLGLEYLHYQGVVHRDIKPANLLRTGENRVKISDFGVSYLGQPKRDGDDSADVSETESMDTEAETELAKTVGTPAFYAPELCDLDLSVEGKKVTNLIDLWALGVTLYCMLFARTPFAGETENEFVLMRKIAQDKIFFPRKRLKAVDTRPTSRSNSVGPLFRVKNEKRLPHEYIHEEIDDELMDLLTRLLIKEPLQRIKLTEVKHHPWVLKDIANPSVWLEQTNPHRQHQGKKIETSNQEVAEAIMPLKIVERASSAVKKFVASGLATLSGRGRHRSKSTIADGAPSSSGSSQASEPLSHREGRRPSLKPSELNTPATKHQEHHEHPLAHSVTASPDARLAPVENPLEKVPSTPGAIERPPMPERSSAAVTSSRTIRQSDIASAVSLDETSTQPAQLTASNLQSFLDPHGSSNLSAIFGGAGRSFLRSMRSRERNGSSRGASPINSPSSTSRSQSRVPDRHVDASLALDSTAAEGRVDPPTAVRGRSPAAGIIPAMDIPARRPPSLSRTAKDSPLVTDSLSASSTSSPRVMHHAAPVDLGGGASSHQAPFQMNSDEASEAEYRSTLEAMDRRRALEDIMNKEAKDAHSSRPASAIPIEACPPSPDDHFGEEKQLVGSDPSTRASSGLVPVSSASSDGRDLSTMSLTTLPSVASTESSVPPSSEHLPVYSTKGSQDSDETTRGRYSPRRAAMGRNYLELTERPRPPPPSTNDEDEGYAGDQDPAVDSDDDDDDDDSDGEFLMMNRVKSRKSQRSARSSQSVGQH